MSFIRHLHTNDFLKVDLGPSLGYEDCAEVSCKRFHGLKRAKAYCLPFNTAASQGVYERSW